MEKLYGYKLEEVIGLKEYLKKHGRANLTNAFSEYAKLSGKAQGTVRNLYYAMAKKTREDKQFCIEHFNGKPIRVNSIVEFEEQEEKRLITEIVRANLNGCSVRSTVLKLSSGDAKLALRYQNKYRNAIKRKPELIEQVKNQLKVENLSGKEEKNIKKEDKSQAFINAKSKINAVIDEQFMKVARENLALKEKNFFLEKELLRLKGLINGIK